jgi:hypothetical protein
MLADTLRLSGSVMAKINVNQKDPGFATQSGQTFRKVADKKL